MAIKQKPLSFALLAALLASCSTPPHIARNPASVAAFKRAFPCPATEVARGPCPGYVVDHIRPLCAGGPDSPINMQWQTREGSLVKDRAERQQCRKNSAKADQNLTP